MTSRCLHKNSLRISTKQLNALEVRCIYSTAAMWQNPVISCTMTAFMNHFRIRIDQPSSWSSRGALFIIWFEKQDHTGWINWDYLLDQAGEDLISFDFSNRATQRGLINKKRTGKGKNKEMELPLFSFSSVSTATNYFSASNKLGEGGFGPVYKVSFNI